jgi:DNA-binding PadR family transcriptional regulator
MSTNRALPRTPLALAVLSLLMERSMHPYEIKAKMQERGHDRVIRVRGASVYDTVERLHRLGFIEPQETSREGRRPERTVYALTESGADELRVWMRELVGRPAWSYPEFGAALAFLMVLRDKDEVVGLLRGRAMALEAEIAFSESLVRGSLAYDVPRMFLIEEEYGQSMRRAELDFVRRLLADLEEGKLWPDEATLQRLAERDRQRGGDAVD